MADTEQHRGWISRVCLRAANCVLAFAVVAALGFVPTQKAQAQTFTVLYSFAGSPDGAAPQGGLVLDSARSLYGTTSNGGAYGLGTVFKLGATGKETVLHSFAGQYDGGHPLYVTLVRDSAGNLYGTTYEGGHGYGVIFQLSKKGKETTLRAFKGWDGINPYSGAIRDKKGNVYVTTIQGGASGLGAAFKSTGLRKGKVLHSFSEGPDGYDPIAPLVQDAKGNLYGTTTAVNGGSGGVVFKLNSKGKETVLHTFIGEPDGDLPYAGLIFDSAGNLFGTTEQGGTANLGTVFKIDAAGRETILYNFNGEPDGDGPGAGSLMMDAQGNLYGTTTYGGTANFGTVFELDTAGNETILYNFSGGADGGVPTAGLIFDANGDLYGTTSQGGDLSCIPSYGCGVVFKLTPH